ncbi:hypothetical protein CAY60_001335 [Shouchella clausii]|uniref:hypothetical protein n=1 Tax=Shouchella TaxID=2893057 RepID=UPI0004E7072B|nr:MULTISPECIES: hypothetical protein [Shouchella]MCM3312869.1 hypothetical protein [Psychrobacillus sp. MER TA 17]ALA53706.1 hypothetical protein DB29_02878 [Shouchella clausii]MBU3229725.1 hypothetical protein [Shouchella clausii]MBU3264191.1 hypothetical protein [Shouchella clausii]MBU3506626.1 hypothetical protein [Shouchella clausii]
MKIAFVLNESEDIVPITEGLVLRVYDSLSKSYNDYSNPALERKEGKRSAALQFAIKQGAHALAAPPETLCEQSYKFARKEQLSFISLPGPVPFNQIISQPLALTDQLPKKEIIPSV